VLSQQVTVGAVGFSNLFEHFDYTLLEPNHCTTPGCKTHARAKADKQGKSNIVQLGWART
jgi:hypothetical protein